MHARRAFLRLARAAGGGACALSAALVHSDAGAAAPATGAAAAGGAALTPTPVVGGHVGMLTDAAARRVLKPAGGKRGEAEVAFYQAVFAPPRASQPPAAFMPRFLGVAHLPAPAAASASMAKGGDVQAGAVVRYLALEDVTAGYSRPCVLDLKMGTQTWDATASAAKAAAEAAKWPLMASVGFRLTGMRVWRPAAPGGPRWAEHGRAYGYALQLATLPGAFAEFLSDGARVRREAIPPLLARLRALEAWFASQGEFRFIGSSLLFIYEGEGAPGPAGGGAGAAAEVKADVRMIDFAHVWPLQPGASDAAAPAVPPLAHVSASGRRHVHDPPAETPAASPLRDEGYLLGIRTVIVHLEALYAATADQDAATAAGG